VPVSASLPLPDDGARRHACASRRLASGSRDADPARVAPFDDPERSSGCSPKMWIYFCADAKIAVTICSAWFAC